MMPLGFVRKDRQRSFSFMRDPAPSPHQLANVIRAVFALPSAISPTAEQIWPDVQ